MGKYYEVVVKTLKEPTTKKEADDAICELLNATDVGENIAEELADKFGIQFSTGDYGNGRTYYPVGTEKGWTTRERYYGDYDENDQTTEGFWVSSSDQC